MSGRDPKTDPRFGDVFRFTGEGYPSTVFLGFDPETPGRWIGLDIYDNDDLNPARVNDDLSSMENDDWYVVKAADELTVDIRAAIDKALMDATADIIARAKAMRPHRVR